MPERPSHLTSYPYRAIVSPTERQRLSNAMTARAAVGRPVARCNRKEMDVDRVAELQRWQDSGAVWEVVSRHGDSVTVALLRCDGGEEAERFTSDDARLLDFIGDRRGSEDIA